MIMEESYILNLVRKYECNKIEKVCMMKKYSVIAVASLLATNLLTFPSSSLAEIENKTRKSIEAVSHMQSNEKSELQKQLEAVKERQMKLEKEKKF